MDDPNVPFILLDHPSHHPAGLCIHDVNVMARRNELEILLFNGLFTHL